VFLEALSAESGSEAVEEDAGEEPLWGGVIMQAYKPG